MSLIARLVGPSAATPELTCASLAGTRWLAELARMRLPQPAQLHLRGPRPLSHCSIIPVPRVCRQAILTYAVRRPLLCLPPHLHPRITRFLLLRPYRRFPSPSAPSPTARGDLTSSKSPDPCRRSPSRPCRQLLWESPRESLGSPAHAHLNTAFFSIPFTRLCCQCPAILREKQQ